MAGKLKAKYTAEQLQELMTSDAAVSLYLKENPGATVSVLTPEQTKVLLKEVVEGDEFRNGVEYVLEDAVNDEEVFTGAEALEKLVDRIYEYVWSSDALDALDTGADIYELYRMVQVKDVDAAITSLQERGTFGAEYQGVGPYWTDIENKAEAYWGNGGVDLRLRAQVAHDDIDWYNTVRARVMMADEMEIRVNEGSVVNLLDVTDTKTGTVYPMNKQVKAVKKEAIMQTQKDYANSREVPKLKVRPAAPRNIYELREQQDQVSDFDALLNDTLDIPDELIPEVRQSKAPKNQFSHKMEEQFARERGEQPPPEGASAWDMSVNKYEQRPHGQPQPGGDTGQSHHGSKKAGLLSVVIKEPDGTVSQTLDAEKFMSYVRSEAGIGSNAFLSAYIDKYNQMHAPRRAELAPLPKDMDKGMAVKTTAFARSALKPLPDVRRIGSRVLNYDDGIKL